MKRRRTDIVRFMARFTARKLCPSIEEGDEVEQMVNNHLWYIRAFILKETIIKNFGWNLIKGGIEMIEQGESLSTKRFRELLESLEYAIPKLVNNDSYHIAIGIVFEKRHLYREALFHLQRGIKLNPKQIGFYVLTAIIKRKLGDPTWKDDQKIADDFFDAGAAPHGEDNFPET